MSSTLPDFSLPTSGGGTISRDDLRGRRTVLYFYPKDDTPGCTLEGRDFTALREEFAGAGIDVFGVSPDSAKSHDRFASKCELGIPLISDPDHVLIDALDLWVEKKLYGRAYQGVQRSTFLIGPDVTVDREWREVKPTGHAAAVLEAVRAGSDTA